MFKSLKVTAFTLSWLIGSVMLSGSISSADPSINDQIAAELAYIKNTFAIGYAPREWKKQQFNWDLDTEYQKSLSVLAQKPNITAPEYRRLLSEFLHSTHDYHVSVRFVTTEKAKLPFYLNAVAGRYFIVWVDTSKSTTVQLGDEVVTFGGRPIADVVAEVRAISAWGVPSTDAKLAEIYTTNRSAQLGFVVPKGAVDIGLKRANADGSEASFTRQLNWEYTPELFNWPEIARPRSVAPNLDLNLAQKLENTQMLWGDWQSLQDFDSSSTDVAPRNGFAIGGRYSYVPTLGKVVWQSADTDKFYAYIYRNDSNQLVGYVRIPHYSAGTPEFTEFKNIIGRMRDATDALVIDEVNNPGGSLFYLSALASLLSSEPMYIPTEQITLWPGMVSQFNDLQSTLVNVKTDADAVKAFGSEDLSGLPVNFSFAQGALQFSQDAIAQWHAGKTLSSPLAFYGLNKVNPDKDVQYTKPILILVNELDFSGGDFFPAIVQDNKRAKIFGQRTSGAGGYILGVDVNSGLGLKTFSFTGSIAHRIDSNPIENLGVTPDIPYAITERDVRGGFVDYKNAVNKAISDMIKP